MANPKLTLFDAKLLEEKEYWLTALSEVQRTPAILADAVSLPGVPPVQAQSALQFPSGLQQKLDGLTQGSAFLLYTTLMAALKVCLYKYTAHTPVIVGSPVPANDTSTDQAANVLAISDPIDDQLTFRQFLLNVRQTLQEAYARPHYPFLYLIRDLGLESADNRCPLFDVALVLEGFHHVLPDMPIDITIVCSKKNNQLSGYIKYNSAIFTQEEIERLGKHFIYLLNTAINNANKACWALNMLDDEESHLLLRTWNSTQVDHAEDNCVPALFEAQAARTPDAVALSYEEAQVTYRQLDTQANQLAHYLRNAGVGPEVLVGIMCERSIELVVCLLAALKAGGAYVPLDPTYPQERLAYMIRDSKVAVLVTQQKYQVDFAQLSVRIVYLDAERKRIERQSVESPGSRAAAWHLAYVIYTSGSTGRPKGVQISHGSLVNLLLWHIRTYHITGQDRASQIASMAFDASVWEIWPYLITGACLSLPAEQARHSAPLLQSWLITQQITHCFVPTPLAESLLALSWPEQIPLQALLTGGDKLHSYPDAHLPFRLVNHYGPTESTVVATACEVSQAEEGKHGDPSIGRPIDNTRVYILDSHLQVVPCGGRGELYISGVGLARGYLDRPALTAERFIPNPFAQTPGERLYRTGDLVRYRINGCLEYLGRVDQQMKIRGFRIEAGEIEAVLREHPAVRDAVVVIKERRPGDRHLIAYIMPGEETDTGAFASNELRHFLQLRLPKYMLPVAYITLKHFPLTTSGKVNRTALAELDVNWLEQDEPYVAPQTATEKVLAGICEETLGIAQIGLYHNFFAMGGHSLLVIQLLSRIHDAFDVEIPFNRFFENPTVAGVASNLFTCSDNPASVEQTAEMLLQLAYLSEQEVEMMLGNGAQMDIESTSRA